MATKIFLGGTEAVAQVETFQVTADDAATTYTMTVGSGNLTEAVSVSGSGTGVNDTASALQVACAASTHPYFSTITWTVSTDTVTATGTTAGVPFIAAASKTGGTGTIGAGTVTTTATSSHHFLEANNYDGAAAPVAGDTVIVSHDAPNICWDLDTSIAGAGITLIIPDTSSRIGLRTNEFATSVDGATTNSSYPEYRDTALKGVLALVQIGKTFGGTNVASPTGRINLYNESTGAAQIFVYGVRGTSVDAGIPVVRITGDGSSSELYIYSCAGGVGLAVGPGQTYTASKLVAILDSGSKIIGGDGFRPSTTYVQDGGTVELACNGDVTAATIASGSLTTRESALLAGGTGWKFVTMNVNGGHWKAIHAESTNAATTVNGNGGSMELLGGDIGTINPQVGFSYTTAKRSSITTVNEPTKSYTVTYS